MKVLFQELKKLFRPWPTVLAIALWLAYCIGSSLGGGYGTLYTMMHTEHYPEHYTVNDNAYSVELQFTDMLLKEYGPSIEREELPRMQDHLDRMAQQILDAAAEDEVFRSCHITLNSDLALNDPEYSQQPITEEMDTSSDNFGPYQNEYNYFYILSYNYGQLKFDTMDEPVYFAQALQELIPQLTEKAARSTDETLYFVMNDTLLWHLGDLLFPICVAVIIGILCLIPPYAVLENRSRTPQLLCSTRTGRSVLRYRIGAAAVCSLLCSGAGVLTFGLRLAGLDLERYYDIPIRDALSPQINLPETFSYDITYLELAIFLCGFLALAGLAITLLTSLVIFHQRNIITALITGIPGALLEGLLWIWCTFSPGVFDRSAATQKSLFSLSMLLGLLLLFLTLFLTMAALYHAKRKEVM